MLSASACTAACKGSSFSHTQWESKGWFTLSASVCTAAWNGSSLTRTGESKSWFTLSESACIAAHKGSSLTHMHWGNLRAHSCWVRVPVPPHGRVPLSHTHWGNLRVGSCWARVPVPQHGRDLSHTEPGALWHFIVNRPLDCISVCKRIPFEWRCSVWPDPYIPSQCEGVPSVWRWNPSFRVIHSVNGSFDLHPPPHVCVDSDTDAQIGRI